MAEPDPKKAKQDWPADCLRRAAEQCLAEGCRNVQVLVLDASRTDTLLGEFTFNFESDDAEVCLGCLTSRHNNRLSSAVVCAQRAKARSPQFKLCWTHLH